MTWDQLLTLVFPLLVVGAWFAGYREHREDGRSTIYGGWRSGARGVSWPGCRLTISEGEIRVEKRRPYVRAVVPSRHSPSDTVLSVQRGALGVRTIWFESPQRSFRFGPLRLQVALTALERYGWYVGR